VRAKYTSSTNACVQRFRDEVLINGHRKFPLSRLYVNRSTRRDMVIEAIDVDVTR
jgi:hypothetical protein